MASVRCKATLLLAATLLPPTLLATGGRASFPRPVRHNFNLMLNARPNQTYRGQWRGDTFARAEGPGLDTDQDPRFRMFEGSGSGESEALAETSHAYGYGKAEFQAFANGTGFHQVTAEAEVVKPLGIRARGEAISTLGLNLGTRNGRGGVRWQPSWSVDTIRAVATAGDPLDMYAFNNDTEELLGARLWDSGLHMVGTGTSEWFDGRIKISGGAQGSFYVYMESPFITSGQGHMRMDWSNGVVNFSSDGGIFEGLMPGVGLSPNINIPFGDGTGTIDITFDMGADNVNGFEMSAHMGSSSIAEAIPEPATMAVLGLGAVALLRRGRRR